MLQKKNDDTEYSVNEYSLNDEEDSYLQDDGQTTKARVVNRSILKYLDLDGLKHLMNLFTAFVSNYAAPKSHNHDATYAKTSHSHTIAQVNNLQETLNGKAPSSHTHTIGGVTNLQTELDKKSDKTHNHDSVYSKISHSHSTDNLTSGTLPIGRGGTGSTNSVGAASTMLNALEPGTAAPRDDDWYVAKYAENGNNTPVRRTHSALWSYIKAKTDVLYAAKSHNHDTSYAAKSHNHSADNITSGVLPIGRGGTGGTSTKSAQYNLMKDILEGTVNASDSDVFVLKHHTPTSTNGALLTRTAAQVWAWIKSKTDPLYATRTHNHDAVYAAKSHNHDAGNITSGVLPIGRGGTGGASTQQAAAYLQFEALGSGVTSIPSGSDLNNYKTPGTFVSTSGENTIANKPPIASGALRLVVSYALGSNAYIKQQVTGFNVGTDGEWIRYITPYENGGKWSGWMQTFRSSGIVPIANGGTGKANASDAITALIGGCVDGTAMPSDNTWFLTQNLDPSQPPVRRTMLALWNYIKSKTNALYLPLTGGTISGTGQIKRAGSVTSWVTGRDYAVLRTNSSGASSYSPIISAKSQSGSWDLGTYTNENLHLSYITDANYNAGTNAQTANIIFGKDQSITASTFKGNLFGNASTANLATAVKDKGDGRTLYLNYSANAMISTDYFATWEGSTLKSMHKNTVRGVIGAAAASHNHGTVTDNFTANIDTKTDSGWSMIGGNNGHLLKSIRTEANAPSWLMGNFGAGIAFGGGDTKGVVSVSYERPNVKFAGGNGTKPVWNFNVSGTTGKAYNLDNMSVNGHSHAWSSITGKPSTFAPSSHNHSAANITSGTLPVSRGGTGATGKGATLLSNLGITMGTAAAPATGTAGTIYIQLLSAAKSVDEPVTIPELGDDVEYDTGTDIPPISDHNSDGSDSSPEYAPDETVDILEPEQNTQIDKEPSAPEYIDGPEADKINSDGGDV